MQKPVVFIAGVLVGAVAVVSLSALWPPTQTEDVQVAQSEPATAPPANSGPAAREDLKGTDMPTPTGIQLSTAQTAGQQNQTTVVCPEPVEFTPAQLDELAEQRREQAYRFELSNMHLSQPGAFEGKLLTFKGDSYYGSNVDDFAKAEAGGDWAERAQQVLQQFFDANQAEFPQVLVECRATICRIDGKAKDAKVFDRYFADPKDGLWPMLGMSFWGTAHHIVPNDSANTFVLFKRKNDDDFKQK